MSFDATDFLEGLYDHRPAANSPEAGPAAPAPEPEAPGQSQAASGANLKIPAPATSDPVAPGPQVDRPMGNTTASPSAALDFTRWVRRRDHNGRWGWEPPDLEDSERWWARGDFEDFPEPGSPCPECGSLEWWEDAAGNRHCARCEAAGLQRTEILADQAARLRPTPEVAPAPPVASTDAPATSAEPVCRCGSTTWRDVPIHGGQSIRRDCGQCQRFIEFPVWYGQTTLQAVRGG